MDKKHDLHIYLNVSQILLGTVALFFILYIGAGIIQPIIYSVIIAILLNPLVKYLERRGWNRVLAICISLLVAIVFTGSLFWFITSQAALFSNSLDHFSERFDALTEQTIKWLAATLHIDPADIRDWVNKAKNDRMNNSASLVSDTLISIWGALVIIFLIPVYIFTILYYKPLLLEFIGRLFPRQNKVLLKEVLMESKGLIQSYLMGLLIEAALVAFMNSLGLYILGIEYALLFGIIGALLNIIPYIGNILATIPPFLIAMMSAHPMTALWVLVLFSIVQFIDNQFIMPYVVASRVKINAFISIVVVLIGGALWGVSGMFLSIPLTAILKVIFDRIEVMKPLGFLLGDCMHMRTPPNPYLRRKIYRKLHPEIHRQPPTPV